MCCEPALPGPVQPTGGAPADLRQHGGAPADVRFLLLVVVGMDVVDPPVTIDLVPSLHHRGDDVGMLLGGLCADRHVGAKAVAIEGLKQAPHARLPSVFGV